MNTFKAIIAGLIAGLVFGGIWNLQDINYYLGTAVGLVVIFGTGFIVLSATKEGNR